MVLRIILWKLQTEAHTMNKLISLELKRNSLRSYHTGVFISGALMLGMRYLLAAITKIDTSETDLEIFI